MHMVRKLRGVFLKILGSVMERARHPGGLVCTGPLLLLGEMANALLGGLGHPSTFGLDVGHRTTGFIAKLAGSGARLVADRGRGGACLLANVGRGGTRVAGRFSGLHRAAHMRLLVCCVDTVHLSAARLTR